nr:hypothetical protein [Candidatus Delongbacteria bacterium]
VLALKYLIWLSIFLFLPTMNGCRPSIGYPFSSGINFDGVTSVIIKSVLNIIIFIIIVKFIVKFFEKHKIQLRILAYFAIYEAIITMISLKATKVTSFNLQHIGQLTLSWWTNLGIFVLTDADKSKFLVFTFHASAFFSMLLTTLILFIFTLIIEKIILINMKIKELNKANSP